MKTQFFWNLNPGDFFRSCARKNDIFIKRSLTSAELVNGTFCVVHYFAADAEVVRIDATKETDV